MNSKFITLELGIKKNKTDGLLIQLPSESNTAIITTKINLQLLLLKYQKKTLKLEV